MDWSKSGQGIINRLREDKLLSLHRTTFEEMKWLNPISPANGSSTRKKVSYKSHRPIFLPFSSGTTSPISSSREPLSWQE
jgi:hypothetical protein